MNEAHAGTLSVDIVSLDAIDDALLSAWRELAADAVEPNPFFDPQLLVPAVRWLPGGKDVRLLTVWRNERMVLAMPVARGRYRRVPLAALSTWKHPYCYLGTPLVRPGELDEAPAAALQSMRRGGPGLLALEQVYVHGPVARAFRRAAENCSASWLEHDVWERPAVLAQETDEAEGVAPPWTKTLRRLRRNLEREVGTVESLDMAGAADPLTLDAEIDAFLEMELAGWKGRAGTAMANASSHASFFRETCRGFAESARLELWRLQAGDVAAARECHLLMGGTVFHWKTTYDEELSRFSPGAQLELDVLQDFYDDAEVRSLDPCTGNVVGPSDRLYPDRRLIGDVLVGLTPPGRLITRTFPRVARARAWVRTARQHRAAVPTQS
jgi:CelD/BcsL family acetyltransferase involved in cellulose biosynthesis